MCLTVFKYFIGPMFYLLLCLNRLSCLLVSNLDIRWFILIEFVLDNCWIPGGLSWFRILFELSMQVFGLVSLVA